LRPHATDDFAFNQRDMRIPCLCFHKS
jgi:hypothetical protein